MWQGHLKLDYATSAFNITNRFVGTATYALPTLAGSNLLLRETLGGWQANAIVDLRSGTPATATLSTDYAHVNGVGAVSVLSSSTPLNLPAAVQPSPVQVAQTITAAWT